MQPCSKGCAVLLMVRNTSNHVIVSIQGKHSFLQLMRAASKASKSSVYFGLVSAVVVTHQPSVACTAASKKY